MTFQIWHPGGQGQALPSQMMVSAPGPEPTRLEFESDGRTIGIEAFEQESREPQAALIVIHGAGGMNYGNGYIRQLASVFAAEGFATYLVHYFASTGHQYADDSAIYKHFETWLKTIGDAVEFVRSRPGIDPRKVAIFGYSLGGYLAIAHGAKDRDLAAVIELAGGIDPTYAAKTRKLPPTLVLHGDQDRRVLPDRARELERLLVDLNTPHEMKIYNGEGHVLSPAAALDALTRGLVFLNRFLR
jgi:carboxymethylenebutenolidase